MQTFQEGNANEGGFGFVNDLTSSEDEFDAFSKQSGPCLLMVRVKYISLSKMYR